tara:strand:+ start:1610 stop:2416 length:807 start_codon:yes stop_codon:yes gene_type:complete
MQRIIDSILSSKDVLVFLILLSFSLYLLIDSNYYNKSKFNNLSNNFTKIIFKESSSLINYFNLREENRSLIKENLSLRNLLYLKKETINDNIFYDSKYIFSDAKIISNNFSFSKNYLIIDKGSVHGVKKEMGVISSNGIIGIIVDVTEKYSSVMSILNMNSKINAKIKKSFHFGTLEWDGNDPDIINLNDVPKIANIKVGDSIVTGGMSTIFPENLNIGVVFKIDSQNAGNYYEIEVKLTNDMSSIRNVYIINNTHKKEIEELNHLKN